ncbi:MAG: prephenate dehydrogenase [Myxococcota bacterium]
MARFSVIGCGLIGGSLARALREVHPGCELVGVEPSRSNREAAIESGVFHHVGEAIDERVSGSNVVTICAPLSALEETLETLDPLVDERTIVTDTIGVKYAVVEMGENLLNHATFVGAHPMVGGALGGFDRARADLFENARVIICPEDDEDATNTVEAMWHSLGANVQRMSPNEHDRSVATTSHLPYVVALALAELGTADPEALRASGPQWHDVTKRASFDPNVMADVSGQNTYLPDRLRELAARLNDLADRAESDPEALHALAAMVSERIR